MNGCAEAIEFYRFVFAATEGGRAVDHGAELTRPVTDQFYGDRTGTVKDPFGYQWTVSTHVEDVTEAEMQRRAKEMYEKE